MPRKHFNLPKELAFILNMANGRLDGLSNAISFAMQRLSLTPDASLAESVDPDPDKDRSTGSLRRIIDWVESVDDESDEDKQKLLVLQASLSKKFGSSSYQPQSVMTESDVAAAKKLENRRQGRANKRATDDAIKREQEKASQL